MEHLYGSETMVVSNVKSVITYCAFIIATLGFLATILIKRKSEAYISRRDFSRNFNEKVTESFLNYSHNATTANETMY